MYYKIDSYSKQQERENAPSSKNPHEVFHFY